MRQCSQLPLGLGPLSTHYLVVSGTNFGVSTIVQERTYSMFQAFAYLTRIHVTPPGNHCEQWVTLEAWLSSGLYVCDCVFILPILGLLPSLPIPLESALRLRRKILLSDTGERERSWLGDHPSRPWTRTIKNLRADATTSQTQPNRLDPLSGRLAAAPFTSDLLQQ